jgi:hypothetical protein
MVDAAYSAITVFRHLAYAKRITRNVMWVTVGPITLVLCHKTTTSEVSKSPDTMQDHVLCDCYHHNGGFGFSQDLATSRS